jgi:hypothetical protein
MPQPKKALAKTVLSGKMPRIGHLESHLRLIFFRHYDRFQSLDFRVKMTRTSADSRRRSLGSGSSRRVVFVEVAVDAMVRKA